MTPREFLDTVVSPNMAVLDQEFGDLRLALNAALSVDALAGHIFYAASNSIHAKNDSDYREQIAIQHSDFRIMRDLANAIKHGRLTRFRPVVSGADKIVIKSLGSDEGHWDEVRWDSPAASRRRDQRWHSPRNRGNSPKRTCDPDS